MPKAFSETERERIRDRLMAVGMGHFAKTGVRAARVSDIAADAGISKGSFYAFFPSKEALFMSIADARDIQHKADMIAALETDDGVARQVVERFFDFMMERIETDPVLRIVRDTGEISHLMRTVPAEMQQENLRRDRAFLVQVAELLRSRHGLTHADAPTLEGLMTVMLSVSLQAEHLVLADSYRQTVALTRDLFISRLTRGPVT